jgi:hypothetical protein
VLSSGVVDVDVVDVDVDEDVGARGVASIAAELFGAQLSQTWFASPSLDKLKSK